MIIIYNVFYNFVKYQTVGCFYICFNCLRSTQGKKPRVVQDVQTRIHILAAATFKVVVLGFFSLIPPFPSAWLHREPGFTRSFTGSIHIVCFVSTFNFRQVRQHLLDFFGYHSQPSVLDQFITSDLLISFFFPKYIILMLIMIIVLKISRTVTIVIIMLVPHSLWTNIIIINRPIIKGDHKKRNRQFLRRSRGFWEFLLTCI